GVRVDGELPVLRDQGAVRAGRTERVAGQPVSQQWGRDVSGCVEGRRRRRSAEFAGTDRRLVGLRSGWKARPLRGQRWRAELSLPERRQRPVYGDGVPGWGGAGREREGVGEHGGRTRGLSPYRPLLDRDQPLQRSIPGAVS